MLRVPLSVTSLGPALAAAAALVRTAEEEAKAVTEELDEPERGSLRRAFGEGSSGKGVAKAMRGMAGAMKDLEDRQKSRATRVKRDTLDQAVKDAAQRVYSPYDPGGKGFKPLLRSVLDPTEGTQDEKRFEAPLSMRDVEASVHLWIERTPLGGYRAPKTASEPAPATEPEVTDA